MKDETYSRFVKEEEYFFRCPKCGHTEGKLKDYGDYEKQWKEVIYDGRWIYSRTNWARVS